MYHLLILTLYHHVCFLSSLSVSFQCGENQRINYVSKLFENMRFEHSKSSASEDFRRYICYASIVSTRLFNGRKLHDIPKLTTFPLTAHRLAIYFMTLSYSVGSNICNLYRSSTLQASPTHIMDPESKSKFAIHEAAREGHSM